MKSFLTDIIENKQIASEIFKLTFACPPVMLKSFIAGQFAHIKIPQRNDLLLRRPFSLAAADLKKGIATVVYQTAGEGTLQLSNTQKGKLDVLLPLGNGFPAGDTYKRILLVGGGMGVAPLRSVMEQKSAAFDAVLGYKSEPYSFFTHSFMRKCRKVLIATEDGSLGQKGFVTDTLKEMDMDKYDAVFTCGPVPMLLALQSYMKRYLIDVFASLEERMGCGMGGCAVCVCGIQTHNGLDYKLEYQKVCTQGPVFDLRKVNFS